MASDARLDPFHTGLVELKLFLFSTSLHLPHVLVHKDELETGSLGWHGDLVRSQLALTVLFACQHFLFPHLLQARPCSSLGMVSHSSFKRTESFLSLG